MAVLTAGFNPSGATAGATIAATDNGDLSKWDTGNITGTGIRRYEAPPQAIFNKNLVGWFTSGSSGAAFVEWSTSYGTVSESFGRLYLYLRGIQTNQGVDIIDFAAAWRIRLNTNGTLSLSPNNVVVTTSTTVLTTGQWYRLEWHFQNQTGGTGSCSIYASPNSTTATETISSTQNLSPATLGIFGIPNSATVNLDMFLAQIVERGTGAIGPYPVIQTAPAVSGAAPVGSTLSCDGGTWNSTGFTFSYQWTRDGANISGATSSTYVTQAADFGHAVGCTVTATGAQATNETASSASSNAITVGFPISAMMFAA